MPQPSRAPPNGRLGDSIGSASVVVRRSEPPDIALGHGLARLAHAILLGDYRPIGAEFVYRDFSASLLAALSRFYALQDEERAIRDMCARLKSWVLHPVRRVSCFTQTSSSRCAPKMLIVAEKCPQSGLKRAKAEGRILGRPSTLTEKQKQDARDDLATGISVSAVARKLATSRQTIMRVRDECSRSVLP